MPDDASLDIASRKSPRQSRSTDLVAAILQAAVQVLAREGAHRFTTVRVAEAAGVSVGSLYQYFPNKAAILFRLQADEWQRTSAMLRDILEDAASPVGFRVRRLVHAFVRSECEEAAVRTALNDAAPLYRAAPQAAEAREGGRRIMQAFIREALPGASPERQEIAVTLIGTTLSEAGRRFSETAPAPEAIDAFADEMTTMFCAYLGAALGAS